MELDRWLHGSARRTFALKMPTSPEYNSAILPLRLIMLLKSFLVVIFVSCIAISCAVAPSPPALSSLQSTFVTAYPPDRDLPVTCNFWGCIGSEGLSSFSGLQVYPYSLRNIQVSGWIWVGVFHVLTLVCFALLPSPDVSSSRQRGGGASCWVALATI